MKTRRLVSVVSGVTASGYGDSAVARRIRCHTALRPGISQIARVLRMHIWRVFAEDRHLATNPPFFLLAIATTVLCLWAWRLVRLH